MQVWCLPGEGGEPVMLTDEPLGVEGFRCARKATAWCCLRRCSSTCRMRSSARPRRNGRRKGPSARRYVRASRCATGTTGCTQNEDFAFTHVIGCDGNGLQSHRPHPGRAP